MANEHGHLPKADQLTDDQQRRLDTWTDKAYADDNLFRTLANNDRVLEMFLDWVGVMYGRKSELDPRMVELCRIRMANLNECFH
jgi:hypothetical protein